MSTEEMIAWEISIRDFFSKTQSEEEILTNSVKLTNELNFDFFAYELYKATPFTRPKTYVYSNYPNEWLRQCREKNYVIEDPRIQHSKVSNDTLRWSDELFKDFPTLRANARKLGLSYGLTQPSFRFHGVVGLFTLARKNTHITKIELEYLQPKILIFSDIVRTQLIGPNSEIFTQQKIEFSRREKEVLRWTADGKTSTEIGIILNLTADAINFHHKKIQRKIGANNRVQAIAYAIARGYI